MPARPPASPIPAPLLAALDRAGVALPEPVAAALTAHSQAAAVYVDATAEFDRARAELVGADERDAAALRAALRAGESPPAPTQPAARAATVEAQQLVSAAADVLGEREREVGAAVRASAAGLTAVLVEAEAVAAQAAIEAGRAFEAALVEAEQARGARLWADSVANGVTGDVDHGLPPFTVWAAPGGHSVREAIAALVKVPEAEGPPRHSQTPEHVAGKLAEHEDALAKAHEVVEQRERELDEAREGGQPNAIDRARRRLAIAAGDAERAEGRLRHTQMVCGLVGVEVLEVEREPTALAGQEERAR